MSSGNAVSHFTYIHVQWDIRTSLFVVMSHFMYIHVQCDIRTSLFVNSNL